MGPWGRAQKGGWAHGPQGPGPWPMGPRPGSPAAFLGPAPWAHMYFVRMVYICCTQYIFHMYFIFISYLCIFLENLTSRTVQSLQGKCEAKGMTGKLVWMYVYKDAQGVDKPKMFQYTDDHRCRPWAVPGKIVDR